MKILYDSQMFYRQQYGGITRYFSNLISYLNETNEHEVKFSIVSTNNEYIQHFPQLFGKEIGIYLASFWPKTTESLNRVINIKELRQNDFDVFHPTYYHPYFLRHIQKPYVITVHDMVHELFPQYFSSKDKTREKKKKVITNASHIIAISENTRRDILNFYDINPEKISVVHHGLFQLYKNTSRSINKDLTTPYILFVGTRGIYKNFNFFLESIAPILKERDSLQLLCIGGGAFSNEESELIKTLKLQEKVFQYTVQEQYMHSFYKNALLFAFPSLYEGFGLPILEAFEAGCPVAISNTSSFPEVGEDAVAYFDPTSAESIKKCIANLLDNETDRNRLIEQGQHRLMQFDVQRSMTKTLAIYKSLL